MKRITGLLLILLISINLQAQSKGHAATDSLISKCLNQIVNFSIYLPPSYETTDMQYPVLYLLHGGGDDYKDWLLKGQAAAIADHAFSAEGVPEMIIVMPDGIRNWYANDYTGKFKYEDYFFNELIPYVETHYRARSEREYRAISGLSMGGFGTMLYGVKHPEKFIAAYGMSIGMFSDRKALSGGGRPMKNKKWYAEDYFGPLNQDGSLPKLWNENNVYKLIKDMPQSQKKQVHFAIEIGDDELNRDQIEVPLLMKEHGIPVEIRVNDGQHDWIFWRKCLPHALQFVGECFIQQRKFNYTLEELKAIFEADHR